MDDGGAEIENSKDTISAKFLLTAWLNCPNARIYEYIICAVFEHLRGMFEMNCLFLSGDFKFQVSPKVLISSPRSTPCG